MRLQPVDGRARSRSQMVGHGKRGRAELVDGSVHLAGQRQLAPVAAASPVKSPVPSGFLSADERLYGVGVNRGWKQ